ncbi:MAG: hypothetical protein BWY76_01180 [bacterium ADurb.Bin429]|nr:MAG: hypothetical protein BWY76_01180 [bacterium ADurb.Bin429]
MGYQKPRTFSTLSGRGVGKTQSAGGTIPCFFAMTSSGSGTTGGFGFTGSGLRNSPVARVTLVGRPSGAVNSTTSTFQMRTSCTVTTAARPFIVTGTAL